MELPGKNESYADQKYWDERFKNEDTYEWFAGYQAFRNHVKETVKWNDRILMLGCGNSCLSADMYRDGYHHITNIDYSRVVINNMRQKHKDMSKMTWLQMDIRDLKFDAESFDVIMEKGTLDALLVGEKDQWNFSLEAEEFMDCVSCQASKLLKPGGRFISITFSQPHFRKQFWAKKEYDWSISTRTFGSAPGSLEFFYYLIEKGKALSTKDIAEFQAYNERRHEKHEVVFANDSEDEESFLQNNFNIHYSPKVENK